MNVQRIQASGEVVWRAVRVATVAVVTGFVTHAFALGLGQPNVASVLGQPLQMTVPLVMDAGTELAQECVRIIPGNQSGDPTPSLNAGRITIDAVGRQLRVESLRSEEHTSELQSRVDLVCRLLLEKKKMHHTGITAKA